MKNLTPRQKKRLTHKSKGPKNKNLAEKVYKNYLITIIYDGTNFSGYAKQKHIKSIEETLNNVLDEYLDEHIKIINASRTDAGVHACDQKITFKTSRNLNEQKFMNYMKENLPDAIEILDIKVVTDDFHVRYDVINKTYIYKIHTIKNLFLNNYSHLWEQKDIDVEKINNICSLFIGTKDFDIFSSPKKDSKSTERTINKFNFYQTDDSNYYFEINADGFLYNMIRIIIGSIIYYYENNYSLDKIENIIESNIKDEVQPKISAKGLYLYKINYKS